MDWREDRVRFWTAIASGVKTEDACVAARVSGPVGFRWFRHAGGVNPRLPAQVSGRYLSFSEREDVAIWHAQKVSAREIARRLGRSPSTISRELRRNASTRAYYLDYKATIAQWHAERRARRSKTAKLVATTVCARTSRTGSPASCTCLTRRSPVRQDRRGRAGTSRTAATVAG